MSASPDRAYPFSDAISDPEQHPTFGLVGPTPDSMDLATVHGELEALPGHYTTIADRLGPEFPETLVVPALTAARRIEHRSLRSSTRRLHLPLSEVAVSQHLHTPRGLSARLIGTQDTNL